VITAVLLLGLLFGWPLMWPVISLEEQGDAFEALSRSYSFALQRPLHYLFYLLIASLLGALGVLFVFTFAEAVLGLSMWGISWGTGTARLATLASTPVDTDGFSMREGGVWLIGMWSSCIRTVAVAFPFSFFWCSMTAIYLLLRRNVDHTEFDDVFISNEENRVPQPLLDSLQTPAAAATPTGFSEEESKRPITEEVPSDDS
jgi:hypothetical protein